MIRMKRHIVRMLLSGKRGSSTLRMTNDIMELLGMRRRRKSNNSFLTTALGAGAIAYGVKKLFDNQQQHQHVEKGPHNKQEHHAAASTSGLSSERKSAIRNIINSYSKNDPGLRAALQEFSSDLGGTKSEGEENWPKNDGTKKDASDWEL